MLRIATSVEELTFVKVAEFDLQIEEGSAMAYLAEVKVSFDFGLSGLATV